MEQNEYFKKIKSWASNENSGILSENFFTENVERTPKELIPAKIKKLISEIIIGFDKSSSFSQKGDSYRFCKYFVEILHKAISLYVLINDNENGLKQNWEDPSNALKFIENEFERSFLMNIFPNIQSEDFNPNKESFLNWFLDLADEIAETYGHDVFPIPLDVLNMFFKGIFYRDYLMNFREVSHLRNVYRSPLPSRFVSNFSILANYLEKNKIKLIIDLRGEKESNKNGTNSDFDRILKFQGIKNIIVDFNEPKGPGNGYVRKVMFLKETVLKVFIEILNTLSDGKSILFHCHSGKDRTGVIAALLQMLARIDENDIINEYSASGHDTRPHRIIDVINHINSVGGIEKYLESCGFSIDYQKKLKSLIEK